MSKDKVCIKCGQSKQEFPNRPGYNTCLGCLRKYAREYRLKRLTTPGGVVAIKAAQKKWVITNVEKVNILKLKSYHRRKRMTRFNNFLSNIRPLVNASGLETAAMLPKNTLGKHYRWADGKPDGKPCSKIHFPAIARSLCAAFGSIDVGGWRITCDPDGPAIFASRPIPGREIESLEVDGSFEYLKPEWRQVYDDFNFSEYFSE